MRLVYLLLIPTLAFALNSTDTLQVQILKIYDNNILILNRGLEDGINRNDHIKMTTEDGFIARGLCIKSGLLSSHYKIYRVTRPELVSKDTIYNLYSINQSELPEDIEDMYASVDFTDRFEDWNDADVKKQLKLQQKRFAKYDFPSSTEGINIYPEENVTFTERIMARNFDKKKFVKDMKPLSFTLFASPYSSQSLNNQQTADYGLKLHNKGEKYDIIANYHDYYIKLSDPINDKSIVRTKKIVNSEFIIRDFTNSWDMTSFIQFDNARFGGVYAPRQHIKVAPFGMLFEIEPQNGYNYTDLSYFLFYDERIDDTTTPIEGFDPSVGGNVVTGFSVNQTSSSRIRHSFRFRIQGSFNKNVSYANELWYQPAMSLSNWRFDFQDVDLSNVFRLSILLGKDLYLDFENIYTHDVLMKDNYNIDPSVTTNVIHFRYNFDV